MSVYGRFYFKETPNGNLIGEYSNYGMDRNFTESADLAKSIGHFVGEYQTSWIEDDMPVIAKLFIEYDHKSEGRLFNLKWLNMKNEILFIGQGFLCDDILIGDYTDQVN